MHSSLTPEECVVTLVRTIDRHVALGLCVQCAFKVAADRYGMDLETVEDTWINRKVSV
jgi:hypothetical protein